MLLRLAMINFRKKSTAPAPILFVKTTGGGKSLVRDIHLVVFHGVSLTIVPPPALGVDQTSNVCNKSIQNSGDVLAIHLEEIHNVSDSENNYAVLFTQKNI